jgi:hypothetical protein
MEGIKMEFLYIFGAIGLIGIIMDYISTRKENKSLKQDIPNLKRDISILYNDTIKANAKIDKYQNFFHETLDQLMKESVLLPSLIRWVDRLKKYEDEKLVKYLRTKKHPARKASEEVQLAKAKAREYKKEVEFARNRVELYEHLAPWLIDFTDYSLEDILFSLREEKENNVLHNDERDPVSKYLTKLEWQKLTVSERNQLALDRYNDPHRKRSLWRVGIAYERFIGYEFEQQDYKVQYFGATHKKEDLGIDLICENEYTILIIQCKRLSRIRGMPVRENVVAQTYGTTQLYKMQKETTKKVVPVIVTSYELSDEAKRFAEYLDVTVFSNYQLSEYPMIKCNVQRQTGEKIYHLPMDQQYDNVIIGDTKDEFYAYTVAGAENKGFRRAWRWKGNN